VSRCSATGRRGGTRAPCRRWWPRARPRCSSRHSSSAPQPLCKPTTSRLEAGWALSSVEVLRDLGAGRPRPRLQRGHRGGAGGRAPRHGGAEPATRAQRHRPCASQPPRGWRRGGRCPVSRCSATWAKGDRGRGCNAGTGSALVAARHATGVQNPPLELSATAPVQANHLEAGGGITATPSPPSTQPPSTQPPYTPWPPSTPSHTCTT